MSNPKRPSGAGFLVLRPEPHGELQEPSHRPLLERPGHATPRRTSDPEHSLNPLYRDRDIARSPSHACHVLFRGARSWGAG
jgi:hypothetical protein